MKGKNLLITGGAGSTGYAIARKFANEGMNVVLTSRDENRAVSAAAELSAETGEEHLGFALDQGDEKSINRLFDRLEELGRLPDSLVLSAANLGLGMNPLECRMEEFASVVNTNLVGAFMLIRESVRRKMVREGGSVVIIGSNMCRRAIRGRSAYIASKGGLVSLAKALALDFAGYGVRINVLLPGSIHTERWDELDENALMAKRARIPLGVEAFPEEIAEAAYFLASDSSKGMTGAELVVDGGVDAQLFYGI